jgi:hypothetical protein
MVLKRFWGPEGGRAQSASTAATSLSFTPFDACSVVPLGLSAAATARARLRPDDDRPGDKAGEAPFGLRGFVLAKRENGPALLSNKIACPYPEQECTTGDEGIDRKGFSYTACAGNQDHRRVLENSMASMNPKCRFANTVTGSVSASLGGKRTVSLWNCRSEKQTLGDRQITPPVPGSNKVLLSSSESIELAT